MRKVVSPLVLGAILLTSCLPLHAQPAQAPTDRGGQKSGGKVADPGRLLSVEDLNPSYSLSEAGKAYAIRYTSTDGITGTGIVTVSGALFMPKGAPPAGGWPVVAWTHGTVGIGDNCAPSRNPRSERDSAYLNKWLQAGYAIVATDYQGLGTPGPHPYMNSRAAAHSTLDSIRAVVNGRLNLANKALLVGQSQGAAAAFATAGLASEYAPDLQIRGAIATGIPNLIPPDENDKGEVASYDPSKGNKVDPTIAYLLYIAENARQIDSRMDPPAVFTEKALPLIRKSADLCVRAMFEEVFDKKMKRNDTFKADFMKYYAEYFRVNTYPSLRVAMPIFIGIGGADVDAPTALQVNFVKKACEAGSKVEAHIYPGFNHSDTVGRSVLNSTLFAQAVMN